MARGVTRVLGLAVLAVASIGCNEVSLPSTPSTTLPTVTAPAQWTSPAPTTAVWLYYAFPTRAQFAVGSTFSFSVLAIHSDGAYQPLGSAEATWTSSNPAVVRITGISASTLQAAAVGIATITVTARGFSDSATVEIVSSSASSTYPRLTVNSPSGPTGAGETRDARLLFSESPTSFRDVGAEADWSSSDPRVATVAAGHVTAVGQGATEISAFYRGYSDRFRLSVHQADDRASFFTLSGGDVPSGVPYHVGTGLGPEDYLGANRYVLLRTRQSEQRRVDAGAMAERDRLQTWRRQEIHDDRHHAARHDESVLAGHARHASRCEKELLRDLPQRPMTLTVRCIVVLLASASGLAVSLTDARAQDAAPAPVREITLVRGDLYRVQAGGQVTVFLVTPDGIILADPVNYDTATWLRKEFETRFPDRPVRYVLHTHHHFDRAEGASVFNDTAELVGHRSFSNQLSASRGSSASQLASLDRNENGVFERDELGGDAMSAEIAARDRNADGRITRDELYRRVPDVETTFNDRRTIVLGGHSVELIRTGGSHSADMTALHFASERIVFAADHVPIAATPFSFGTLRPKEAVEWVRTMSSLDFDVLISADGSTSTRAEIAALGEYFNDLVASAMAGYELGLRVDELSAMSSLRTQLHRAALRAP